VPEGDTVHKLARALARDVEGRPLEGLWLRDRGWVELLAGRRVREVAALGKHLLVAVGPSAEPAGAPLEAADRTSDDWVLHVHLGMNGRFHRYREGERWQRPARQASIQAWSSLMSLGAVNSSSRLCIRLASSRACRALRQNRTIPRSRRQNEGRSTLLRRANSPFQLVPQYCSPLSSRW